MDAIALLCEIIAQSGKVAAHAYRDDPGYGALLDAGLLTRDGMVQSVLCDDCDAPHEAPVIYEAGAHGYHCPDLGFVPVERAEITAIRPDLGALVGQLGAALGCDGRGARLASGTWRIGLADTPGGRAAVYFHSRLADGDDLAALETALRGEIRRDYMLILTAFGTLPSGTATTLALAQMVRLDSKAARLAPFASVAQAVGAPPKPTGGRPNTHGERVFAILSERATQGIAEPGRNAEAVIKAYVAQYPDDPAPSVATVARYVTQFQTGS